MPITLGDAATAKLFLGSTELLRVYHGAVLVHDVTDAPIADFLLTEDGDRITHEDGSPIDVSGTVAGLATATDLDGTEWAFILQDGATVKVPLSDLQGYFND